MNAPLSVRASFPDEWELVRDHTYTMTLDDFASVQGVVTDAVSGRMVAFGTNQHGVMVKLPIGVPLCCTCDLPVGPDGVDSDCKVIHCDIAERLTEVLPDPFKGRL